MEFREFERKLRLVIASVAIRIVALGSVSRMGRKGDDFLITYELTKG
jgi:hypothetical protein